MLALAAAACALSTPGSGPAFLQAEPKDEEVMGPNLNFSPLSTTMKCILSLTMQYIVVYTALGICRTVLDFQNVKHKDSNIAQALQAASETMFYAPMVCMMFIGFRMRVLQLTKGQGAPQEWVQVAMHSVTYAILANTLLVLMIPIFVGPPLEIEATGEIKTEGANPFGNPILMHAFTAIRYAIMLGLYVGFGVVLVGIFKFTPDPAIWEGKVPPISPAVACTVMLTCCFFIIYFWLAISRTYSQYLGGNAFTSKFQTVMTRAADTLAMAPMLCALFLAARMRALQMDPISGNPQRWAQGCFYACSCALVAQAVMAIVVPLVLQGEVKPQKEGDVMGDAKYEVKNEFLAKCLTLFRFVIMLSVYACAVAVVCSVFTIKHPQGAELTPPLSPTMQCVLNLAFQYFLIYLLLWIFHTVEDFTKLELTKAKEAIESAKSTVQFAPMLAVLFIATRMRALQMTDNKGAPQGWVQDGMYLATWSILIQFLMCLIMPVFTNKTYDPDTLDGSQKATEEPISNYWGAMAVTVLRYFALLALLGGVTTVTVGVFMMTPETANGRGAIPVIADGTIPGVNVDQPVGINDVPGAKGAMESVDSTVGSGVDAVDSAGNAVNDATVGQVTG